MSNAEAVRRYYRKNKEKIIAKQRERRKTHPEIYKVRAARDNFNRSLKKYGLSKQDYELLLICQGGVCGICKQENNNKRNWHIDHCHDTGRVRGVLCHHCNLLLGNARDSIDILDSAKEYLIKCHQTYW